MKLSNYVTDPYKSFALGINREFPISVPVEMDLQRDDIQLFVGKDGSLNYIIGDAAEILAQIKKLASIFGNTDNGVIAARDKMLNYVKQVHGDAGADILLKGYSLAHADIPNRKLFGDYSAELTRLFQAGENYIKNHAADSSTIFHEEIDPNYILSRYTQFVAAGDKIDHAFWKAFTGQKDPFDIRSGVSLPAPAQPAPVIPSSPAYKSATQNSPVQVITGPAPAKPGSSAAEDDKKQAETKQVVTYVTLGLAAVILIVAIVVHLKKQKA